MKKVIVLLTLFCIATFAQQQGSFTDPRDGKKYKTVKIGVQTWMAENLNYAAGGSKCYNDNSANCQKYGRLYEWETAMRACPSGWRLPSDDEWEILIDYVGGTENAGTTLKSRNGWNKNGNGTNNYGFSALPGGNGSSSGKFGYIGEYGGWWSASWLEDDITYDYRAYYRFMYSEDNNIGRNSGLFNAALFPVYSLFSVRCIKD